MEDRIEADLAIGRHRELLPELAQLVDDHPWRERLRGHQMLALYRSGRQGDALAAYSGLQRVFADELGIDPGPELRDLQRAILQQDSALDPVARSTHVTSSSESIPRSSLPEQLTLLVERPQLTDRIAALLDTDRIVTLTGPGGAGKTRMALHLAAQNDLPPGRSVFVDLAAIEDPSLVAAAVATALGLDDSATSQRVEAMAEHMESRGTFLVLDNCEHVIEPLAALVEHLLRHAPTLTVLATSREALRVQAESVISVPPLELPDDSQRSVDLRSVEAVALFLDRVRHSAPDLDIAAPATLAMAARICQQLDGMPLAIELAAAKAGSLSLGTIVENLDRQTRLLTSGPRTAPARQRSLRAVVDWSYDQLNEEERRLFRALSVFRSGFTVEAAEAMASGIGLDSSAGLELVPSLVEKSLLMVDSGRVRYRLLEPLRQYAELQVETDEALLIDAVHASYFASSAQDAATAIQGGSGQTAAYTFFVAEVNNLRRAMSSLADRGNWQELGLMALTLGVSGHTRAAARGTRGG